MCVYIVMLRYLFLSLAIKLFLSKGSLYIYSKTPHNAVSVLRCGIGIPLNRILYGYLLYMCANETALHQPKLGELVTVYAMYPFVSVFRIKIPTVFHLFILSCLV